MGLSIVYAAVHAAGGSDEVVVGNEKRARGSRTDQTTSYIVTTTSPRLAPCLFLDLIFFARRHLRKASAIITQIFHSTANKTHRWV